MSNKTDTKLTFAAIMAMPRGERYTLFKDNVVKPFSAITKAKDAATEKMHMAFKVTASLKRDYASMLRSNPRYGSVIGTQDGTEFAKGLQRGGYATDPSYAD